MEDFFVSVLEANRELERYISAGLSDSDLGKGSVGAGGDISRGIDIVAEKVFVTYLSSYGRIVSEESGTIGDGDTTIVIDPIDGSSNIISGLPYYGTSVAMMEPDGVTSMAVVCNLANGDIFFKKAGDTPTRGTLRDAWMGRYPIVYGSDIGIFERAYMHADIVRELDMAGMKFRAPGAVALSLVYARNLRYFIYMGSQRIYDFAAGLLFCEDMEVIVKDDYVIVAVDKTTLDILDSILIRQRSLS